MDSGNGQKDEVVEHLQQLIRDVFWKGVSSMWTRVTELDDLVRSPTFSRDHMKLFAGIEERLVKFVEAHHLPKLQWAAVHLANDLCVLDTEGKIGPALVKSGVITCVRHIVNRIAPLEAARRTSQQNELLEIVPLFLTTLVDEKIVPKPPEPHTLFELIKQLLMDESSMVASSACYWLCHVGGFLTEACVRKLVDDGILGYLIRIISTSKNAELIQDALLALEETSLLSDETDCVAERGLLTAIQRVLGDDALKTNTALVKQALKVVNRGESDIWTEEIINAGLLERFLEMLLNEDEEIQFEAAHAISELTSIADYDAIIEIDQLEVLATLVDCLVKYPDRSEFVNKLLDALEDILLAAREVGLFGSVWESAETLELRKHLENLTAHKDATIQDHANAILDLYWMIHRDDVHNREEYATQVFNARRVDDVFGMTRYSLEPM